MMDQRTRNDGESRTRRQAGQRQLTFDGSGKLAIKETLVNPVPWNDPSRLGPRGVARETRNLLPGLLATRPDVTCNSYSYNPEVTDLRLRADFCPGYQPRATVRVLDSDTIDAALSLQRGEEKPVAILNMANEDNPGGGWLHGAIAQEEALCRRTSLSCTLHESKYPLKPREALYSPTVLIIRDVDDRLLDFREPAKLVKLSVISCAAICKPKLRVSSNGGEVYRYDQDMSLMEDKIRTILRTTIRNGHRQVVLGALGCGVFANPPREVARMWLNILQEPEFQGGWFLDVVFAVLASRSNDNYGVFHRRLDGIQV